MKRKIAISFENELVKVVYAHTARTGTIVERTLTFDNNEFDRFLAMMPEDEFIVVQNFEGVYQDIVSLPPAKKRFIRPLVELEIKKRIPDLKDFSFCHVELRDVKREGKRTKDVFFLAVDSAEIQRIVERLGRAGKVASGIYANVLPLSRFTGTEDSETDEAILGVLDIGTNKTIFLTADKKLAFVRVTQSHGRGMSLDDLENINMTTAYCRQVLRINPSRIVFPDAAKDMTLPAMPVIQVSPVKYPSTITAFSDALRDYVAPLSAIDKLEDIEDGNLLPDTYRDIVTQRKLMGYCILILCLLSLLSLGYIGFQWMEISRTRTTIAQLRNDIQKRQAVIGEFERVRADLNKLKPSIEMVNAFGKSTDLQNIFVALQSVSTEGVDLRSIGMKNDTEFLVIEIKGNIRASSYKQLQMRYEEYLGQFTKMNTAEVMGHKLDLNDRSFTLDLKWKV